MSRVCGNKSDCTAVCDTSYKKRADFSLGKVAMQEKQPNRITEKAEYQEKNKINKYLKTVINKIFISSVTDKKLSKYVLLLLFFLLRIQ